jgi:phosphoribosylamine--glycine ligase
MRFGWPLAMIQMALHEGDPVEWMYDLLAGRDTLEVSKDIAVGVVLSHGDYPNTYFKPEKNTGFPITGITPMNENDIHMVDVCKMQAPIMKGSRVVDEETYCTAGNYVLVTTGTGKTVEAAREECYKTIWDINIPSNRMFRTDIGKRLEDELPELQKHGYATGMKYK